MKKSFLKKIISLTIIAMTISTTLSVKASASWSENSFNKWNWIENGVKATGWKKIDVQWYNFKDDGTMNVGWIFDKGNWYNLSLNGSMRSGWIKDSNNKWYHLSSSGAMDIGWINDDDTWYYTNYSGEMVTGATEIDGKLFMFSESGAMLTDQETINNSEIINPPILNDIDNDEENKIAYVLTESSVLNVRSEASLSSAIIGTLPQNSSITVIGDQKNGFWRISANGLNGWVSSTWISFKKPNIIEENSDDKLNGNLNINENTDIKDKDFGDKPNSIVSSIRIIPPNDDNKCYYSDSNIFYKVKLSPPFLSGERKIEGNCTWYAWGRAWEITGEAPIEAGFTGNAYSWWEANKKSGKYKYGSTPKVGAIAVWSSSMPNSGNHGHVAVVEKIENGKVYISESMWYTVRFKYREIYDTQYLYGYIYLDEPNY